VVSHRDAGVPAVVISRGVLPVGLDGSIIIGDRSLVIALTDPDESAIVVGASETRVELESAIEIGERGHALADFRTYVASVVISGRMARVEFESAVEVAERRLDLSFGDPSAGARVIRLSETRIEGDGDAVIVDGAIIFSPRLPFTAPREVRSRRLRARRLRLDRLQRGE